MSRLSFRIIFSLTSARKMVVAEHVAEKLGLLDYVAIRGVASPEESIDHERTSAKWSQLEEGGTLLIHFGGTLISETGLDLFYDTVVHLMNHADLLVRDIKFQLTGIGNLEKIRALQEELAQSTRISVELLPGLSKRSYLEVIEACHASLSLKKPESELANTTFPSKVIEITSAGLALVTTRLGDVPKIFGENSAFFLEGYEPLQLAQVLIDMTNSPARVKAVAKAGREACMREFSLDMVGLQMNRLF